MADNMADYMMEATPKTVTDIKVQTSVKRELKHCYILQGGTLIELNGRLMHLEMPQVPADKLEEFCSLRTFK